MGDLLSVHSSADLVAGDRSAAMAGAGTVPVGTVRVCAPCLSARAVLIWRLGRTRTGRECSTGAAGGRPGAAMAGTAQRARLHGVPMMPNPLPRLDHNEIEPQRQVRQCLAAGQRTALQQPVGRRADTGALAVVDRLLR